MNSPSWVSIALACLALSAITGGAITYRLSEEAKAEANRAAWKKQADLFWTDQAARSTKLGNLEEAARIKKEYGLSSN